MYCNDYRNSNKLVSLETRKILESTSNFEKMERINIIGIGIGIGIKTINLNLYSAHIHKSPRHIMNISTFKT